MIPDSVISSHETVGDPSGGNTSGNQTKIEETVDATPNDSDPDVHNGKGVLSYANMVRDMLRDKAIDPTRPQAEKKHQCAPEVKQAKTLCLSNKHLGKVVSHELTDEPSGERNKTYN